MGLYSNLERENDGWKLIALNATSFYYVVLAKFVFIISIVFVAYLSFAIVFCASALAFFDDVLSIGTNLLIEFSLSFYFALPLMLILFCVFSLIKTVSVNVVIGISVVLSNFLLTQTDSRVYFPQTYYLTAFSSNPTELLLFFLISSILLIFVASIGMAILRRKLFVE